MHIGDASNDADGESSNNTNTLHAEEDNSLNEENGVWRGLDTHTGNLREQDGKALNGEHDNLHDASELGLWRRRRRTRRRRTPAPTPCTDVADRRRTMSNSRGNCAGYLARGYCEEARTSSKIGNKHTMEAYNTCKLTCGICKQAR